MIVLDASVVVEVLLNGAVGEALVERIVDPGEICCAPQLLDVEVLQVLRRYDRSGELGEERGRQAIADLNGLPIHRYPHEPLRDRVWQLRKNLTAYDAVYVALAEALNAPLLTRDSRLAATPGHEASIETV